MTSGFACPYEKRTQPGAVEPGAHPTRHSGRQHARHQPPGPVLGEKQRAREMVEKVPKLPWRQVFHPLLVLVLRGHLAGSYTNNPQFYKRTFLEINQINFKFTPLPLTPNPRFRTA